MLLSFSLATFLVLLGLALLWRHVRVWRTTRERETNERETAFARRQFRRRRWTSALILLLGVAIAGGEWVRSPLWSLAYWLGVLLLVLWVVVLAILDAIATQQHFGVEQAQRDAEEAVLLRQLRQDFGREDEQAGD